MQVDETIATLEILLLIGAYLGKNTQGAAR